MINTSPKYSYNDLYIVPKNVTYINHRAECSVKYNNDMLPLMAAPMASVVNENNLDMWGSNGITAILPRNINLETRKEKVLNGYWVAFGLDEFNDLFVSDTSWIASSYAHLHVLIDIENGHMMSMLRLAERAKDIAHEKNEYVLILMCGNVANSQTYYDYAKFGIDYIRCGIGGGHCCTTSSNTAIHYPMASLIDEMHMAKKYVIHHDKIYKTIPLIVADGGIRNFDNAIVALALGADYVMIGTLFGSFFESAAEFGDNIKISDKDIYVGNDGDTSKYVKELEPYVCSYNCNSKIYRVGYSIPLEEIDEEIKKTIIKNYQLEKKIFGMSTRKAQQLISNGKPLKTAEGIERTMPCKYTTKQWVDNFIAFLRSAMSYCDTYTLEDFIGNVDLIVCSPSERASVNK